MIRVLVYLVVVALLAFGAVWFAERPGDVAITWQGRRIDTSVMVLVAAVAAVAAASVMAWSILRAILRAPDNVARYLRIRRVDEAPGSDAAAVVARSEAKAARGDLAGAVGELAELPPNARAPAEAWIKGAQARIAAIDASRRVAGDALSGLGK